MKNKGGRPKGSKNQPTLFKVKRTKLDRLKLTRECLRIVHARAEGSGLSPQTVLEDLIMAGDYTMGQAYDNLSNFRKRIREKASERNNVTPVTSTETNGTNGHVQGTEQGSETMGAAARDEHVPQGQGTVREGSLNADEQRGHRPEDNPAFGMSSAVGDVIGVGAAQVPMVGYDPEQQQFAIPDYGPVPTDEEGNPIEPQEVHEEDEALQE